MTLMWRPKLRKARLGYFRLSVGCLHLCYKLQISTNSYKVSQFFFLQYCQQLFLVEKDWLIYIYRSISFVKRCHSFFKELSIQWKSSKNAIVHEESVGFLTKHSWESRISQWSPSLEWDPTSSLDQFSQRPCENGKKGSGVQETPIGNGGYIYLRIILISLFSNPIEPLTDSMWVILWLLLGTFRPEANVTMKRVTFTFF